MWAACRNCCRSKSREKRDIAAAPAGCVSSRCLRRTRSSGGERAEGSNSEFESTKYGFQLRLAYRSQQHTNSVEDRRGMQCMGRSRPDATQQTQRQCAERQQTAARTRQAQAICHGQAESLGVQDLSSRALGSSSSHGRLGGVLHAGWGGAVLSGGPCPPGSNHQEIPAVLHSLPAARQKVGGPGRPPAAQRHQPAAAARHLHGTGGQTVAPSLGPAGELRHPSRAFKGADQPRPRTWGAPLGPRRLLGLARPWGWPARVHWHRPSPRNMMVGAGAAEKTGGMALCGWREYL